MAGWRKMMLLAVLLLERKVATEDAAECIDEVDELREGPGEGRPRNELRKLEGEILMAVGWKREPDMIALVKIVKVWVCE